MYHMIGLLVTFIVFALCKSQEWKMDREERYWVKAWDVFYSIKNR